MIEGSRFSNSSIFGLKEIKGKGSVLHLSGLDQQMEVFPTLDTTISFNVGSSFSILVVIDVKHMESQFDTGISPYKLDLLLKQRVPTRNAHL